MQAQPQVKTVESFDDLCALVAARPNVFVRYSRGPDIDGGSVSIDYESGLTLPGLSANPLHPEAWWTRPVDDWVARQVCRYVHLRDETADHQVGWVLTGTLVGRGPGNEPLLDAIAPVAVLADAVVDQAKRHYGAHFDVGRTSESAPRRAFRRRRRA